MVPNWTTGDRLRKARESHGVSVEAMAQRLGVNRRTIARWERDRSVPKMGVMAYALACDVPVEWLEEGKIPVTAEYRGRRAA